MSGKIRVNLLFVLLLAGTLLLLDLGTIPRSAAGAEIRVDASAALGDVHPTVFGNSLIWGGDTMGYSKWVSGEREYEEAKRIWNYYLPFVSEMAPTVLRYPGGLEANNFDWKQGIGPILDRDPGYDGEGMPQTFGTDEFLQYCEEIGAQAIFVINVSVGGRIPGNVQDAADWVEYCNALNDGSNPGGGIDWAAVRAANGHKAPYGVRFWELGNEETYPGWEDYARRVKSYSAAMKAIDPSIQTGAIRSGTGLDATYQTADWLSYQTFMLVKAGDAFDFWIQHEHIPSSDGLVNGFSLVLDGASVSASFSVEQQGAYTFQIPAQALCKKAQCPRLLLFVDEQRRGEWSVGSFVSNCGSQEFFLSRGEHRIRLEADALAVGSTVTICQQVTLKPQGSSQGRLVDLKKSLEFYHAVLSGWKVPEAILFAGQPVTGGKPVFYTEVNTAYREVKNPPYFSKSCALREVLSTALLYNVFLRNGVELANYWMLFDDRSGIGVLEGVAVDEESGEQARPDPHRRPVFHLLKLYRWNVLEQVVLTEVRYSPDFLAGTQTGLTVGYARSNEELDHLQVVATRSRSNDKLSVIVINSHPEQDLDVPVYVSGFQPKFVVDVQTLTGSSRDSTNEPVECPAGDCVRTVESAGYFAGSPYRHVFPKHSVTVLRFYRSGSDQDPPVLPAGLAGSAGDGKALLVWNANPEGDLLGYRIYRSRCPEGPFRHCITPAPVARTEYMDLAVDNGVDYTYAVKAVDRSGNESEFSGKIRLTPLSGSGEPQKPQPGGQGDDNTPPSPPLLFGAD